MESTLDQVRIASTLSRRNSTQSVDNQEGGHFVGQVKN